MRDGAAARPFERGTRSEVVVATPWEALCMCAQAHDADLIVIGSHGYGGLDRVLGTTAARVVNHALCSVFVVRCRGISLRFQNRV